MTNSIVRLVESRTKILPLSAIVHAAAASGTEVVSGLVAVAALVTVGALVNLNWWHNWYLAVSSSLKAACLHSPAAM